MNPSSLASSTHSIPTGNWNENPLFKSGSSPSKDDSLRLSRSDSIKRDGTIGLEKSSRGEKPKFETGLEIPSSPRQVRAEGQQQLKTTSFGLRCATAVAVGVGTFLRAALAVGTLGLSEGVKALAEKLIDTYGTRKRGDQPISVLVPPSLSPTLLDPKLLPGRVATKYNPDFLEKIVQHKITQGHALVSKLMTGTLEDGKKCSVEDMSNIMFYVQARGEEMNGASFKDGAFTLPDPGNRIRQFLDSCPMSYQRDSSHITAFQTDVGAGHRGIDAYGSGKQLKEYLPHGMKTLLYGSVPQHDGLRMPEERIYLKLESHGAWLTRPRGGDDANGPHRRGNHHDVGAFLGHSLSFIVTRFQKAGADTRKERIPTDLAKDYKELMTNASQGAKALLERNASLSTAGGIRIMMDNLRDALRLAAPESQEFNDLKGVYDQIFERYPDDFNMRFGNEIVMLSQDVLGGDGERRVATEGGGPPKPMKAEDTLENRIIREEKERDREMDVQNEKILDRTINMSDQELGETIGTELEESRRRDEVRNRLKPQTVPDELDRIANEVMNLQKELEELLLQDQEIQDTTAPTITAPPKEVIDTNKLLDEVIQSFDPVINNIIPDLVPKDKN